MAFCVTLIATVRLPSLKVSTLLLVGFLIYDILWMYFYDIVFNTTNVMTKAQMSTRQIDNPFSRLFQTFNDYQLKQQLHSAQLYEIDNDIILTTEAQSYASIEPAAVYRSKLTMPGMLLVPNRNTSEGVGQYSLLGLSDIVVPGLLLCFALRFDIYKQHLQSHAGKHFEATNKTPARTTLWQQLFYFKYSMIGYLFGMLLTGWLSMVMRGCGSNSAFVTSPSALLFLVPSTLVPFLVLAYFKVKNIFIYI